MTAMKADNKVVEDVCKELYIRALKRLPDDIKAGFQRLDAAETDTTGKRILGTMIKNITVAESTDNLLCQDTGLPIYNVAVRRRHVIIHCAHPLFTRSRVSTSTPARAGTCRSSMSIFPIAHKNYASR